MHIAASTRSLWDIGIPAACLQLQELGFDKVEYWFTDRYEMHDARRVISDVDGTIKTLRESSRLTPVAVYLDQELELADFQTIVTFARQMKIAQLTINASPLGTPFNTEIDRLRERNAVCHRDGVRLSILTKSGQLTEDPHTAVELCQSVKGLGITLDPSYYICTPRGSVDFDVVFDHVLHCQLRDTSPREIQVSAGLGEVDYNRITAVLRQLGYQRALSVDLLPETLQGEERLLELRKIRLLLETLL